MKSEEQIKEEIKRIKETGQSAYNEGLYKLADACENNIKALEWVLEK